MASQPTNPRKVSSQKEGLMKTHLVSLNKDGGGDYPSEDVIATL